MSKPSNSYAEKVYSEHPVALWSLDDQADYVSLITEEQRNIGLVWNGTGGGSLPAITDITAPFQNSIITGLMSDVPATTGLYTYAYSPNLVNFQNLNFDLSTFAISTYFYSESIYLQEIQIGYEYTDPDTLEIIQNIKSFETSIYKRWSFISSTFNLVDVDAEFRIILKLKFFPGAGVEEDYKVYFNGITAGQWSEEFCSSSLGLNTISLPNNIAIETAQVIELKEYQLSESSGYYFTSNNSLLAKNSGIPLVYGASNSTRLYPNGTDPSLIIPGFGFLNESGKYNDYTVEFWTKIENNSSEAKRIFGPIASKDGLYVESGFLTLLVGDNFKSFFVGEWSRPMLIQIRIIKDSISLLLNGEEVISFEFKTKDLSLPSILNNEGKEQDWLGFYCDSETVPFELDCISIYSYNVPAIVAKRRWVYGQAVLSPEKIESSYNGLSSFIDYPFSEYTANYSYPSFGKWSQGTFDNLITTQTTIKTPEYELPNFFLSAKTIKDLYYDCKDIQTESNKFFTFRPNSSWNGVNSYFYFSKFNIINDEVHSLYAVLQIDEDDESDQVLVKIYNSLTGNFFSIEKRSDKIYYSLNYGGAEEILYTSDPFTVNEKFSIGIDIRKITNYFGKNVSSFFGNKGGLNIYVAGDPTGTKQFVGKIYAFGICSEINNVLMTDNFDETGITLINSGENFLSKTASYTLIPEIEYEKFYLDIGTYSNWQDYLPLSYFGKYIKDKAGNEFYDLDFLQLNIGYPATNKVVLNEDSFVLDTSGSTLKSYITFQEILNGANLLPELFTTIVAPPTNGIIDLNNYPNWKTTKFEFVDNTIVYVPQTVDFNDLAIVYTMDFINRGTQNKPTTIKNFEISSKSLDDNSFNVIGTRFGTKLYPYRKSGIYYDHKGKNPYSIYKGSTPYLYLTKTSGIQIKKDENITEERGIAIPINESKSNFYKISATQMWFMDNRKEFSDIAEELFKIEYKEDTIIFYIVANSLSKNRARIYAQRLSDGKSINGLTFYLNGKVTNEPVISLNEWNVLGVSFGNSLNFSSYLGKLTLNGYCVFNSISFYRSSNLKEIQSKSTRSWFNVKTQGPLALDWQYWENSFTWEGVLIISVTENFLINLVQIYNSYLGINKFIVDDNKGMTFDAEKMTAYTEVEWFPIVQTPV